jgi:hypothetical protein
MAVTDQIQNFNGYYRSCYLPPKNIVLVSFAPKNCKGYTVSHFLKVGPFPFLRY